MSDIKIFGINGPVITTRNHPLLKMLETVWIGKANILGEVIAIGSELTVIQAYENTSGLRVGEPIKNSGSTLSVTLGPGLIGKIYDGIGRPLDRIYKSIGDFLVNTVDIDALDSEIKYQVRILAGFGEIAYPGKIVAEIKESKSISHKIMIPNEIKGKITFAAPSGEYKLNDTILAIEDKGNIFEIKLFQKWPVRTPRPFKERKSPSQPLITGQRVIDTLFPLAKGGAAAIPGGYGTGKTVTQHQLAKWSEADIVVYIGCGERGNEMVQVLEEFSNLIDPRNGEKMMERTILIANTSNMPVASREASIYSGITIAEYYRDMGYHVALMADSTSRWAEALREISGRLEELPGEEGFPTYLSTRLSEFYERAGYVTTLGGEEGSISIIGAVSPQGGDFSEPVTQNTKRFVRCFWALDKSLAYQRHYPTINWIDSYSEYFEELLEWYDRNVSPDFGKLRNKIVRILSKEKTLMEIVKLVGSDILPEEEKLVLEISKVIKLGFLQQNAHHNNDKYTPLERQFSMLRVITNLYQKCKDEIKGGATLKMISSTGIFEQVAKMKYEIDENDGFKFDEINNKIFNLNFVKNNELL